MSNLDFLRREVRQIRGKIQALTTRKAPPGDCFAKAGEHLKTACDLYNGLPAVSGDGQSKQIREIHAHVKSADQYLEHHRNAGGDQPPVGGDLLPPTPNPESERARAFAAVMAQGFGRH
jgi:hypothetical protein